MTQQHQMIAVKGTHARRHVVHTLDTCSVAIVNRYKPRCPFSPPHSLSKIAVLCLPLSQLLQTINIHSFLYTSTHRVSICAEVWRSAARVGSVLLELCGVLQQVFIYQFSGCRCPVLLKTSHGISWHCHGVDTTSHTYTRTRVSVYVCDVKVIWSAELFIAKKSSYCQKIHM